MLFQTARAAITRQFLQDGPPIVALAFVWFTRCSWQSICVSMPLSSTMLNRAIHNALTVGWDHSVRPGSKIQNPTCCILYLSGNFPTIQFHTSSRTQYTVMDIKEIHANQSFLCYGSHIHLPFKMFTTSNKLHSCHAIYVHHLICYLQLHWLLSWLQW